MSLIELKRYIQMLDSWHEETGEKIDRRPLIFLDGGKKVVRSWKGVGKNRAHVMFTFSDFVSMPLELIEDILQEEAV